MNASPVRPTRALARFAMLAATALLATGLAWLAVHWTVGAGGGGLPHPAERWLVRAHVLAAFVALAAAGAIGATHVPAGWRHAARVRATRQRTIGVAIATLALACALAGYLLLYFVPESMRTATGWVHAALGAGAAIAFAAHVRRAVALRRPTRRRPAPRGRSR